MHFRLPWGQAAGYKDRMSIELSAGIAIANTAITIIKALREAIKEKKRPTDEEMKDYLVDLQEKVTDVKASLLDAEENNRLLQQELLRQRGSLISVANLHLWKGYIGESTFPTVPYVGNPTENPRD